jgi:hypothetical protein
MFRLVGILLLAPAVLLAGRLVADDNGKKAKSKAELDRMFRLADTNKDGKLSRAEFRRLVRNAPKLKDNPQAVDRLFTRLDSDGDGFLSPAEFRQLGALMAQGKTAAGKPTAREPDRPATAEGVAFFEKKIRPVLVAKCYECHSSENKKKARGGLILDTRAGLRTGGDTGPAVVPGKPEQSLLIKALRHGDDKLKMPPKEKLSGSVVADFERWVRMGAPDPRDGKARVVRGDIDIEKGRQFWAFQPPRKNAPPAVKNTAWPRGDVDRFLLAALEARGLAPVGDADRRTLIRRLSFDLVGLPPTPEEVEAFVNDSSSEAFAKVVDRLLDSPRFGERWGRHWLDVARYAESSGKQVNFNYPHAWRYRDWVIAAFNADKPYNRFVQEQVAGDLLPAKHAKQQAEQLIATGFLAIGPKPHNERSSLQFSMDVVDEQIDTVSQAFLGLTVSCARCHDHKFDPIPMRDYYALAGIFRSTETNYGTVRFIQNAHPSELFTLPAGSGQAAGTDRLTPAQMANVKRQKASLEKQREELRRTRKLFGTREGIILQFRLAGVDARLASYEDDGTPKLLAMGVRDRALTRNSPVYQRGEIDKPGDMVPRGFVQVVSRDPPRVRNGSGRLELAQWLTSRDNPLTARVLVNRVWLHLFGRALVASPDNFGASGRKPSHPELLDHLAVTFQEGWSVKKLIRQIVLSRAYALASTHDDTNHEADPENTLVWRMRKRRLEAEPLRDAMLAISGQLDLTPPKGSPVARFGEGLSQALMRGGPLDARLNCRSVYLPVVRDQHLDSMALFDFADASLVSGERATTTVPSQSLYLLNNPFVIRQAEAAAARLKTDAKSDSERIRLAYLRFLGRPATAQETRTAQQFLESYPKVLQDDGVGPVRRQTMTWAAFCQALFASAEFQYLN